MAASGRAASVRPGTRPSESGGRPRCSLLVHVTGDLTLEDRDRLISGNVFAERRSTGREGHVSLFLSRTPLDRIVHGVWPLLTTWGGEGVGDHEKCRKLITKSAELAQIIGAPFSLSS